MVHSSSLLKRFTFDSLRSRRPPVAVEIAPRGITAAGKRGGQSEIQYASCPLPSGAVTASVNDSNLHSPEEVSGAIRAAIQQVSGASGSVTVVVPDATSRVFALEFDSWPNDNRAILAILRLRLKKVVPFDVDSANISYQVLRREGARVRVLAVVVSGKVLNEYEAVVREAGYEPGAVLPSALSALAALDSSKPALCAFLGDGSLTTSITDGDNILLYRTHDLPPDPNEREAEIQRDIAVAIAYFEDELKEIPHSLQYAGSIPSGEFCRLIHLDLPVVDLSLQSQDHASSATMSPNIASLVGALAGARVA